MLPNVLFLYIIRKAYMVGLFKLYKHNTAAYYCIIQRAIWICFTGKYDESEFLNEKCEKAVSSVKVSKFDTHFKMCSSIL